MRGKGQGGKAGGGRKGRREEPDEEMKKRRKTRGGGGGGEGRRGRAEEETMLRNVIYRSTNLSERKCGYGNLIFLKHNSMLRNCREERGRRRDPMTT